MESYEGQIWPVSIKKGLVVIVTRRARSLNNGSTWHTMTYIRVAEPEEVFSGICSIAGASESGFWGNCNEIRGSGHEYCSQYDGAQWRTLK